MGEKLEWFFRIIDEATGPAGKIADSLAKVDKAAKGLDKPAGSGLFQSILGGMTSGAMFQGFIAGIGNAFGPAAAEKALGLAGAVAQVGPVIEKLGPAAASAASFVGKAFVGISIAAAAVGLAVAAAVGSLAVSGARWAGDALMFKENSLVAFKTMLGSQAAAEKVYAQAAKFAAITPFTQEQVVSSFQRLITAGFKTDSLNKLMLAAGDVGAAFGTEKMDSFISALSKIQAKGKLGGEEMMTLAEGGVSMQKIYEALAKSTGHSMAQVKKDISGGKIKSTEGIAAIMSAVETGLSGGKLGSLMEAQSQTLSGLFSTLKDSFVGLLDNSNALKALEPLKKFINNLIAALDPQSDTGKRIIRLFDYIAASVGSVFGDMAKVDLGKVFGKGLDVLEPLIKATLAFGEGFIKGLAGLGPFMDSIGKKSPEEMAKFIDSAFRVGVAAGQVAVALVKIIDVLISTAAMVAGFGIAIYDALMTTFDSLNERFFDIGGQLIRAMALGIASTLPIIGPLISGLGWDLMGDGSPSGSTIGGVPTGPSGGVGLATSSLTGGGGGPVDQSRTLNAQVSPGAVVQNFYGQENAGATAAQGLQGQLVGVFATLAAQAGG